MLTVKERYPGLACSFCSRRFAVNEYNFPLLIITCYVSFMTGGQHSDVHVINDPTAQGGGRLAVGSECIEKKLATG